MAIITVDVCGSPTSSLQYTYDDQSNLITSAIAHNDAASPVPLTVRLTNPSTQAVIFTHTLAINTGNTTFPLSGLNIHMVASVDKTGAPSVVAPFNIGCSWG